MKALRVLLVDDHALVRAGLRALLESLPDIEVVGEARNGREALGLVAEHRPDVTLMNISMPELNGLEATARAVKERRGARVLLVSMHADEEYVRKAFELGAAGYLLKSADRGELELATRAVARGDAWLSPGVSGTVVQALRRGERPPGPFELLTSRQREVLQLLAEGLSTKEIARRLALSAKTVDAHRAQLMLRLGVRGVAALARAAVRLGVVSP